ncbi:hypothetical protein SAMN05216369_1392 [Marinobacter antarcticus]|uniref:Uncharacterized protein n=1 Tax=Marinobacter antarcticus TaxID=564117 RepID=A0A1M6RAW0_9GAMM|nr:hypothetical protein [Marinobacter antarcticus]SHK29488.1 hypothetical protein SAMN05216369_1392 [Marinobacter antarcticus]
MAEASPGENLRELRGKYITNLPDRMGELRNAWNRHKHVICSNSTVLRATSSMINPQPAVRPCKPVAMNCEL